MSKAAHINNLLGHFDEQGVLRTDRLPLIPQGLLPGAMTTPLAGVKQVMSFEEAQQPSSDAALNDSNRWMSQGNGLSSPNYAPSVNAVRVNRILYTNGVGAQAFPGTSDADYAHEPIFTVEKRTVGQDAHATAFTAGGLSGTSSATQILTPIDLTLAATEEVGIRWTSGARPAQVHLEVETTGTVAGGGEVFYDLITEDVAHSRPLEDYNIGFVVTVELSVDTYPFFVPPITTFSRYVTNPTTAGINFSIHHAFSSGGAIIDVVFTPRTTTNGWRIINVTNWTAGPVFVYGIRT